MIKILMLVVAVIGAGAAGFFGERLLRPVQAPEAEMAHDAPKEEPKMLLFKLPLGRFTVQIPQRAQVVHMVFDIDVFILGEHAFAEINGAMGKARLRDATVTAIAELAETDLTLAQTKNTETELAELAAKVVRKLYLVFPEVRTARVNSFVSHGTPKG